MDSLTNFDCRTCLVQYGNKFQYIDWKECISDLNITYMDCLNTLLGFGTDEQNILSNYNIPTQLCLDCCDKLTAAYHFVQKAQEAHETLRLKCIQQLQADFEWVPVNDKHATSVDVVVTTTPEGVESVTQENFNSTDCEDYKMLDNNMEIVDDNAELVVKPKSLTKKQQQRKPIYSSKSTKITKLQSVFEGGKVGDLSDDKTKGEDKKGDFEIQKCNHCEQTMFKKQMRRHVINAHNRWSRFLCHICPQKCNNPIELRRHELTHNANRERNFSCDQCDLKFHTEKNLKYHAKTHDSNRQRIQCDQCEKSFLHRGSLNVHKQRHTGQMIECQICQKFFLRPKDLEMHWRTHSGELPFPCDKCEKAFMRESTLKLHMRHHEGYRYDCDICGKMYRYPSSLHDHRKLHTGLPLQCAICSESFGRKSRLIRHIGDVHNINDSEEIDKVIIKVKIQKVHRDQKKGE